MSLFWFASIKKRNNKILLNYQINLIIKQRTTTPMVSLTKCTLPHLWKKCHLYSLQIAYISFTAAFDSILCTVQKKWDWERERETGREHQPNGILKLNSLGSLLHRDCEKDKV